MPRRRREPGILSLSSQKRRCVEYLLLILLVIFTIIDYNYFTHPAKLPFRQMAFYVQQTRSPEEFLINWNSSSHHLWETKYYGIPAPIYIPGGGDLPYFVGTALMEKSDVINSLPVNTSEVGVISSGSIEEVILPDYTLTEETQYKGLKYLRFVKK